MKQPPRLEIALPGWLDKEAPAGRRFPHDRDRMNLVISLSEMNVRRGTGGPFAAVVFEEGSGRLVAAGVNVVEKSCCSAAHAEILALALAQKRMKRHRLNGPHRRGERFVLVSSAQPCAMCFGALLWAGIDRLVFGALGSDVERLVGFDEGPRVRAWRRELARRGIAVRSGLLRSQACRVLRMYKARGGRLY